MGLKQSDYLILIRLGLKHILSHRVLKEKIEREGQLDRGTKSKFLCTTINQQILIQER